MEKDFHLHNSFVFWIHRLSALMQDHFNQQLSECDVTWPQWMVLNVLYHQMGQTPAKIAECVGIDRSAITRLVDRLEGKGLVEREYNKLDRRSINVHITSLGKETMERINDLAYKHQTYFLKDLHTSEQRALKGELQKMLRAGGIDNIRTWKRT
jgi:DNA-binding MarR family transcriptional regulator